MTAPAPLDLPALLDDLERAHAAATPGPWKFCEVSDGWDGKTLALETIAKEPPHADGSVSPVGYVLSGWGYDASGIDVSDEDAALIVAAVNAVPTLIAELRKRDVALKAVLELCANADHDAARIAAEHGVPPFDGAPLTRHLRATLTAALSPESVQS